MERMLENPGIVKSAAANAHTGAAGFLEHPFGGFGGGDVAVSNDRDALHCFNDSTNAFEIDGAAKSLLTGAAVDEDGSYAHRLESPSQIGRCQVFIVPAETHLGGDGNFDRVDHAFDEGSGLVQLGHHRRTAANAADLADRAAHVDIDRIDADAFEILGGGAHFLGN